jgi:CubicO group peptidase (beta-lactamase class C family)
MEARGEVISTYEELLDRLAREEVAPLGPPGRIFSYSGEGYALLAAITERVSGRAFPAFVHEHVLGPLGMTGTGFRPGTFDRLARSHPVAQLYTTGYASPARQGEKALIASPAWWGSGRIYGHANMVSTVRDLLRFAEFLVGRGAVGGRRLAAPHMVEQMLTPHAPIPTGGFYGYGLFIHPGYYGGTLVEHGGGGKGASAKLAVLLEAKISAAALANSATAATNRLALGAVNALAGLPPDAPLRSFPEYEGGGERLARFAGTYRWNDGEEGMTFEVRGGVLYARTGGQSYVCRPFAADGVVVCGPEFPVRFLLDGSGVAWARSDGARVSRKVR